MALTYDDEGQWLRFENFPVQLKLDCPKKRIVIKNLINGISNIPVLF